MGVSSTVLIFCTLEKKEIKILAIINSINIEHSYFKQIVKLYKVRIMSIN